MSKLADKLNPGHYLELMDRLHVAICTLEEHCTQHPLSKVEPSIRHKLYNAIDYLVEAYQEVGKLDYERNKT